jgi:hypothetical protein
MSDEKQRPQHGKSAQSAADRRQARQAEALRTNLRRRKEQARARDDEKPAPKDKE